MPSQEQSEEPKLTSPHESQLEQNPELAAEQAAATDKSGDEMEIDFQENLQLLPRPAQVYMQQALT
jgi:hypothetical protein